MGQTPKLNRLIIWGEPEERFGLTFYPLTMEKYELWLTQNGALTMRMSTLPARYAVRPYIDALYMMAVENKDLRYFGFKLLMALALGIPEENAMSAIREQATSTGLKCLTVRWGENITALLPHQVDVIRKVIVQQNGASLPDESENAEIVEAENDLKNMNGMNDLDLNMNVEIESVAAASGLRKQDIKNMTILEYTGLKTAHTRRMNYLICAIAEANGINFKGVNPVPTWLYNRLDPTHGLINLNNWDRQMDGVIKNGAPQAMGSFMPHS